MNKIVFFLGAGASRCAGGPLISDFIPAIDQAIEQGLVPKPAGEAFRNLRLGAQGSGVAADNIEELLKWVIDNPGPDLRETLRLVSEVIGDTLESRITFAYTRGRLVSSDHAYWQLAMLLRDLCSRDATTAGIVTVNYDICADVAIMEAGYRCYYCLNPDPERGLQKEIRIAKLHGSLNWHGCVGGQCAHISADPHIIDFISKHCKDWPDDSHHQLHFEMDDKTCNKCSHPMLYPLIVPPVPDKRLYGEKMKVLWDNARRMLDGADLIALVGYSCSDIDRPVNDLIRNAGKNKQILIANPSCKARERAKNLLSDARFIPAVDNLEQAVEIIRREGIGS